MIKEEKIIEVLSEACEPEEVAEKLGIPKKEFVKKLEERIKEHQEEVEEIFEEVAEFSDSAIDCQAKLVLAAGMARRSDEEYDIEGEMYYMNKAQQLIGMLTESEDDLYEALNILSTALESLLFVHTQQDKMFGIALEYDTGSNRKLKAIKNITNINSHRE